MSTDVNLSVHSRTVNAFFDDSASAKRAVEDLVAAGIPREHISQSGGQAASSLATDTAAVEDKGFWDSLKDLFLPEEDRHSYAEGLRRGGYLVTVRTEEANYSRVLDILDRDGSIDMDEREQQWKSEGWSGFPGSSTRNDALGTSAADLGGASLAGGVATGLAGAGLTGTRTETTSTTSGIAARPRLTEDGSELDQTAASSAAFRSTQATDATAFSADRAAAGREDVIPVYEEQLRVGKRDVEHGRVRVRSYVVETPVSEQVSLRSESVSVERRPVDRAVAAGDAVFQDRTIEVEERAEEAVISKEARVTEEISLRKTAEDRVETVSDTVRHTEVDITDDRAGHAVSAVATTGSVDASRIVPHMDVISADGQKIGVVDHLDGPDRIKLAKNSSPDGQHHFVPFSWIDHIDAHVHLTRTLAEIKAQQQ